MTEETTTSETGVKSSPETVSHREMPAVQDVERIDATAFLEPVIMERMSELEFRAVYLFGVIYGLVIAMCLILMFRD